MGRIWWLVLLLSMGCGDDEEQAGGTPSAGETNPGEAEQGSAGGGSDEARAAQAREEERAAFARSVRETRTHLDLLALAHLADVDHGGPFIDFGTPARMKHTVGRWRNDWGSDGSEGDRTFTRLATSGRVYFHLDRPEALTAQLRLEKVGTPNLVFYINGETLRTVDLSDGVQTYEVPIPAEHLRAGENALRLRATQTTALGDEEVSVSVDSIHLRRGSAEDAASPPAHGELSREITLGEESRQALVVPTGTTLRWHLRVPASGSLLLGLGGEAEGAEASIHIQPESGEEEELFAGTLNASFDDQLISLAQYAGKHVRLELRANGTGDGQIAFAEPKLVVPMPDRARVPGQARNVVVLTIDTLRASKLRPYNRRSRVQTPAFDAFAEDATVFENAQSPENWTKPAVASILTSLHPMTHNTKRDAASLPDAALTLGEVYQEAGFRTGTFLANGYVSDRFGFNQGWHHYTNYIRENRSTEAAHVFGEAAEWIEEHKDERFFVYIQTIDPHVPYDPPDEFLRLYDDDPGAYGGQVRNRMTGNLLGDAKRNPPRVTFNEADKQRLADLHDAEISYHDRHFGAFLEKLAELGLYEDMVFVVTSDHGEEFEEHGSWGHGHSVFQELLHVPLVVRWPRAESAGERVPHTVSTMDIGPTILEATGVDVPSVFEGRSLLGFMRNQPPPGPAVAFSDFLDDRRVIRSGRWKLILRGNLTYTMFDLERDPGEQNQLDRADANPIALRYLRVLLGQYLGAESRRDWLHGEGDGGPAVLPQQDSQIDAELCQQLTLLGYIDARCDAL